MKSISAAEANRHFSALLRDVAQGEKAVILSRGKSVATMAPVSSGHDPQFAKRLLLQRLRTLAPLDLPHWSRDALYAR